MKRLMLLFLPVLAVLPSTAHAATPTVTKAWRQYSSYRYTVVADHGKITASPTQGDPTSTGGCVLNWVRTRRGHTVDGATCSSTGTVTFATPDFPVCDTPFTVSQDNVTVFSDLLNTPCPPPAPPAVVVYAEGDTVLFANPATVDQPGSFAGTVPAADCAWSADAPFTTSTVPRFAGTGPNRYVYYWATVDVSVPAGGVVTATLVCGS